MVTQAIKTFLYSSSGYICHLLLISSVRSCCFCPYYAHLCMKNSLGISNFLGKISSLPHSIVFLYFFSLISEKGFLISPCYSPKLCLQMGITFLFPLPFTSLLFSDICKASSDNHIVAFHFFFFGMILITPSCTILWTSAHISSRILLDLISWIYLSPLLYNHNGFKSYLNGLAVFSTSLNLSLIFAIRSSWSEPQSAPGLVFVDCVELLQLWLKIT